MNNFFYAFSLLFDTLRQAQNSLMSGASNDINQCGKKRKLVITNETKYTFSSPTWLGISFQYGMFSKRDSASSAEWHY